MLESSQESKEGPCPGDHRLNSSLGDRVSLNGHCTFRCAFRSSVGGWFGMPALCGRAGWPAVTRQARSGMPRVGSRQDRPVGSTFVTTAPEVTGLWTGPHQGYGAAWGYGTGQGSAGISRDTRGHRICPRESKCPVGLGCVQDALCFGYILHGKQKDPRLERACSMHVLRFAVRARCVCDVLFLYLQMQLQVDLCECDPFTCVSCV